MVKIAPDDVHLGVVGTRRLLTLLADAELMKNEIAGKLLTRASVAEDSDEWHEVGEVYTNLCSVLLDNYLTLRAYPMAEMIKKGISLEGAYCAAEYHERIHHILSRHRRTLLQFRSAFFDTLRVW